MSKDFFGSRMTCLRGDEKLTPLRRSLESLFFMRKWTSHSL